MVRLHYIEDEHERLDQMPRGKKKPPIDHLLSDSDVIGGLEKTLVSVQREIEDVRQAKPLKVVVNGKVGDVELPAGSWHSALPSVLKAVSVGENVFLAGPAGTGKSTIAYQIAETMEVDIESISLGPTTPTSKLFGFIDANGQYRETPFRRIFEGGGVFLADEIDNGHPGLVAELNQALAGETCAFADMTVRKSPDFRFIATANTFGKGGDRTYVGRNALDAATLDRFSVFEIDYDDKLEENLARSWGKELGLDAKKTSDWLLMIRGLRKKAEEKNIRAILSTRSIISGIKLISTGMPEKDVIMATIGNGFKKSDFDELLGALVREISQ